MESKSVGFGASVISNVLTSRFPGDRPISAKTGAKLLPRTVSDYARVTLTPTGETTRHRRSPISGRAPPMAIAGRNALHQLFPDRGEPLDHSAVGRCQSLSA